MPAGFGFRITDRFRTENDFHGGLVGLAAERRFSSLFVSLRASVALGDETAGGESTGAP